MSGSVPRCGLNAGRTVRFPSAKSSAGEGAVRAFRLPNLPGLPGLPDLRTYPFLRSNSCMNETSVSTPDSGKAL